MISRRIHCLASPAVATLLIAALAACGGGSDDAEPADSATAAPPTATAVPGPDRAAGSGSAAAGGPAPAAGGVMVDPTAATRDELVAVPGMTAAAADALIAARPVVTMAAVDRALAAHLGAAERRTVYARLWKPIDLNSATGDEILLIPGVGPRMRHEFGEYRPYRSMEQFRREIGKYVDEAEVARSEQYVTIR